MIVYILALYSLWYDLLLNGKKRKPEGTSKPNNYLDLKQQYMHVILVHEGVNHLDTFVKLHILEWRINYLVSVFKHEVPPGTDILAIGLLASEGQLAPKYFFLKLPRKRRDTEVFAEGIGFTCSHFAHTYNEEST